jgi:hypothetical protein
MSRRVQHPRTAPAEGGQRRTTGPRQRIAVTALTGSGLSGAALSWSLLSHSPLWAVAASGVTGVLAVAGAATRHTPDLVRAWNQRSDLRTVLREVREFAREDLLSAKITPQELLKLAGDVHRQALENRSAEPQENGRNDN